MYLSLNLNTIPGGNYIITMVTEVMLIIQLLRYGLGAVILNSN